MPTTLLDLLREDHAELRRLLADAADTSPDERGETVRSVLS